jgi:flagellar assembly protein FliH
MVEIRLSKIIKASENAPLQRFDFSEIEMDVDGRNSFVAKDEKDRLEGESENVDDLPSQALHDLEEAIRNRMLEAERHAQELEKTAYEKGYVQGQKDGFEYGRKSASIIQEQLENILKQLGSLPAGVFKDYRQWFIDACLTMVRRIVQRELTMNPENLTQLMTALLNEAEENQSLILYLNPRDLDMLKKNTPFEKWMEQVSRSFLVKADAGMTPGGCRLESEIQVLDAGIETQFALLEEALRGELAGMEAEDLENA